jgi:predicted ATPase/class 3 adenylate cyclase
VRDLPGGTVTFLFTDIEGSTRLLDQLGADRYAVALAEHHRVLRETFDRHGGVEVDTQGDAFFVAFPTAPGALEAAREAQDKLELPVRMGLHTGTPLLTEEGYVGRDVHRAARVAAAGHGRQVLVSAATAALVDPAGLRDLGRHRLKDLSGPEHIFQLGDAEFPELKTLADTNLPIPATAFLGRDGELAEVRALLGHDDVRLLTLTGAGGTGKTRLALQAAAEASDEYPDGVWWVPLAPVADRADVEAAAAQALGGGGTLADLVDGRRLLLLLDNFEHVVEAAADVAALLAKCPHADVLVTSRERLRVQSEQVYPVPVLERTEARRLFAARARAARPDFAPDEHLDDLCARLDDLPLALELAAARTSLLSTQQLVERLGDRLDLLRGGRDAETRQQTLRATLEWSHDLLDGDEQRLFRRLAAFAGGSTLEAAEEVTDADIDTLHSLVDKSLVRFSGDRYWMLGTIREFATERLADSGEEDEMLRRLAVRLLALAESARLLSESDPPERPELVRPELDNFRRAIDWAREHDPELAFRLAVNLELFWVLNDPFEGARRMKELLETDAAVPSLLRARALRTFAEAAATAGDEERGFSAMAESLAEFERIGDEHGIAIMRHRLSIVATNAGDIPRARQLLDASLTTSRRLRDRKLEADCVRSLGGIERAEGNLDRAVDLNEQSIVLLEQIGHNWLLIGALLESSDLAREQDQMQKAEDSARKALRVAESLSDRRGMIYAVATLAQFFTAGGQLERSGLLWGALEAEAERAPVGAWERVRVEAAETIIREEPEFARGREEGRGLSFDDVVQYALGP